MKFDYFPCHCGSEIIYDFYNPPSKYELNYLKAGGSRTFFGIFVDEPTQKKSYIKLKNQFKILYQSPILVNPQTNREYFIVIWLNEKP